jgi:hypothetical protein
MRMPKRSTVYFLTASAWTVVALYTKSPHYGMSATFFWGIWWEIVL